MATTSSYRDYQSEARELVQSLIISCLQKLASEETDQVIQWSSVAEFTPQTGQSAIEQLIKSWQLDESWLHHTTYNGVQELGLHGYSVIFSQPSRRKPVPRATASVFFYIATQDIDKTAPVQVFYVVEGQRVVLRPGHEEFREIWLRNVISSKLAVTGHCVNI